MFQTMAQKARKGRCDALHHVREKYSMAIADYDPQNVFVVGDWIGSAKCSYFGNVKVAAKSRIQPMGRPQR